MPRRSAQTDRFRHQAGSTRFVRPRVETLETRLTPTNLPSGFTESLFAEGLTSPTAMAFAPDGRLFVAEQSGTVRVVSQGRLLATPFVSLNVESFNERGLLGIAFDPNFTTNQYVYLQYTARTPTIHNRVSRVTATGNVAVAGSEVVLLELDPQSDNPSHVGGSLQFGPDGKLYIGQGDNGQTVKAQALDNLFGKILRINPDGTIPTDNPFYNVTEGANRSIWARGLRNPFTMDFDPATGRLFVNDVGEATWEEINLGVAGGNYGWPTYEGPTTAPNIQGPVFAYRHGFGGDTGAAITGGVFYSPARVQFPSQYAGDYFFVDFVYNWMKRLDTATGQVTDFATNLNGFVVDLDVDASGSLFYLSRETGSVFKIEATTNQPPRISQQPVDQKVSVGQSVTFHASASGSAPLTYQWQRNGADIAGATSNSLVLATTSQADNGATYRAVVRNAFGVDITRSASLSVVTNQPPTATIETPVLGLTYKAGDTIAFSGRASDGEDGDLPASAFTWRVDWHTGGAVRPVVPTFSGLRSSTFSVPTDVPYRRADVFYSVHLTVTDSSGLTFSTVRNIFPQTTTLQLETSIAGLQVTLDGQPVTAPLSILGVAGLTRTIGVVSPQTINGVTYVFDRWEDGSIGTRTLTTPGQSTTYVATYHASQIGDGTGINDNQAFVSGLYRDLLDRPVDPSGLGTFTLLLDRNRQSTLEVIAADFLSSRENRIVAIQGFYFTHLRRQAGETEVNLWLDRLQRGQTLDQVQIAIAASDESFNRSGRDNGRWVDTLYQNLLGRPRAGDPGAQSWVTRLNLGLPRTEVVNAVLNSEEGRAILIRSTFTRFLGRPALGQDIANWLSWFRANPGLQATPSLQAQVLASREAYRAGGNAAGGWIALLYQRVFDRPADTAGLLGHVGRLLDLNAATRQQVALTILSSDEYRSKLIRSTFEQYLGRPVSANELNLFLAQFRRGVSYETFLLTVFSSDEYFARYGSQATTWIDHLYVDVLARVRDAGGSEPLLEGLLAGNPRQIAVTALLSSNEYHARRIQATFSLLRRPAETPEVQAVLDLFQSGVNEVQMQAALLALGEYYQRPHVTA